ncbi:MAG: nucleotidyl transferase AbiEii/AbiGii toxin family protein [Desulfobacteraceae bacterium]|nr:nucleotidyl transferase AbiEii/AbiGii toxin family protein [Desulfobacteraceae bacterium]
MDPQPDGSGKWRNSAWKRLLELVLPALDDLPKTLAWTLGGGTGLAISLKHRISYDIDIFFQDAAALKLLSPNKNKKIRSLSDNWQQPGHYLKIERPEGDIDFLVAHFLTENPFFQYNFMGKKISVETPAEIIAKKIHYRGSQFTVRDIFDIAAFSTSEQGGLSLIASEINDDLPRVLDRIKLLRKRYEQTIHDAVFPTETGKKLMDQGAGITVQALEAVIM